MPNVECRMPNSGVGSWACRNLPPIASSAHAEPRRSMSGATEMNLSVLLSFLPSVLSVSLWFFLFFT